MEFRLGFLFTYWIESRAPSNSWMDIPRSFPVFVMGWLVSGHYLDNKQEEGIFKTDERNIA
jgi:hypothetical protein